MQKIKINYFKVLNINIATQRSEVKIKNKKKENLHLLRCNNIKVTSKSKFYVKKKSCYIIKSNNNIDIENPYLAVISPHLHHHNHHQHH